MRWSPVTYWWPGRDATEWRTVLDLTGPGSIVVLDSLDWPEPIHAAWAEAAATVEAAGATPVVYVPTHMGMAGSPAEWGGGREDAARYSHEEIMAQVRRAITATRARGVFLDEFSSLKGPHAVRADWYRALLASIRREYGLGFLIVGNPGVNISTEASSLDVDVWLDFEDTAARYLAPMGERPDWLRDSETDAMLRGRRWHVIREARPEQVPAIMARSRELGAEHVYVTDRALAPAADPLAPPLVSPYGGPPSSMIMSAVTTALRGREKDHMSGSITGGLTDLLGRPLQGTVRVPTSTMLTASTALDGEGRFEIEVQAGSHMVAATLRTADGAPAGVLSWPPVTVQDGRSVRVAMGSLSASDAGPYTPPAPVPEQPPTPPGPDTPSYTPAPYLKAFVDNEGQPSTMPINVIGDSWTGGDVTDFDGVKRTENRWEKVIKAQHLNNFTVNPQAISGQLTGDFLLYTDAISLVVTGIEGGKIPGDTTTEKRLTLKDPQFFQKWAKLLMPTVVTDSSKYRTYWLADGLAGTRVNILLRKDDSGYYFTAKRSASGPEVNVPNGEYNISFNMGADIRKSAQFIIELGINDAFQWDASYAPERLAPTEFAKRYIANLRSIIEKAGSEYAGAQKKHLAVLTIPPMSGEAQDSSRRKLIDAANAAIKAEFGPLVIDIASYLTSEQALKDAGVSVTSGDREDLAKKSLPRSLMGSAGGANKLDNTHMNSAGHKALAKFVGDAIKQRKWVAGV